MKYLKMITILAMLVFVGCENPIGDESLPAPEFDCTGTWDGGFVQDSIRTEFMATITQNENNIYGTLYSDSGYTFSVTGTTWEDNITLLCVEIDDSNHRLSCRGTIHSVLGSPTLGSQGTFNDGQRQGGTWFALKR